MPDIKLCKKCGLDRPYSDFQKNKTTKDGLLCSSCNKGLGLFKDNTDILQKAREYIARSQLVNVSS